MVRWGSREWPEDRLSQSDRQKLKLPTSDERYPGLAEGDAALQAMMDMDLREPNPVAAHIVTVLLTSVVWLVAIAVVTRDVDYARAAMGSAVAALLVWAAA